MSKATNRAKQAAKKNANSRRHPRRLPAFRPNPAIVAATDESAMIDMAIELGLSFMLRRCGITRIIGQCVLQGTPPRELSRDIAAEPAEDELLMGAD